MVAMDGTTGRVKGKGFNSFFQALKFARTYIETHPTHVLWIYPGTPDDVRHARRIGTSLGSAVIQMEMDRDHRSITWFP